MRGFYLYDPVDVGDDFDIKTCPDRSIFRLLSGSMLVAGRLDGKSSLHCWVEKVVPTLAGARQYHDYDADFHNTIIWQELCEQIRSAP